MCTEDGELQDTVSKFLHNNSLHGLALHGNARHYLPDELDPSQNEQAEDWDAQVPQRPLKSKVHAVDMEQAVLGEAAAGDGGKGKGDGAEEPVQAAGEGDVDTADQIHVLHPQRHALQRKRGLARCWDGGKKNMGW